jgi:RNA polymerase sigma-70 factor (ECF subfamily)
MEPIAGARRVWDMNVTAPDLPATVEGLDPPRAPTAPPVPPEPAAPSRHLQVGLHFEDFYRQARPSIARAVALAVGDVDLATEATDEAMTRAYERWSHVSQLERPEAWVYRVAMNWSTSVLRRRQRRRQELYATEPMAPAEVTDPDVHAALAELDAKQRSVIVCRHLLGWSVAETADALDVREGTVKSRLHRARQILQARLGHLRTPKEPS